MNRDTPRVIKSTVRRSHFEKDVVRILENTARS